MIWFHIIALLISVDCVSSQTKQDHINVITEIFTTNQYNKKVLPQEDATSPVVLDLSFFFLGINEIDELAEKLVTTGYLLISWTDDGLAWNSTQHNNLETIFIPQTDIWKPDIFLQNGFTKFKELGGSYYYMEVISDGAVLWMPFEVIGLKIILKQ